MVYVVPFLVLSRSRTPMTLLNYACTSLITRAPAVIEARAPLEPLFHRSSFGRHSPRLSTSSHHRASTVLLRKGEKTLPVPSDRLSTTRSQMSRFSSPTSNSGQIVQVSSMCSLPAWTVAATLVSTRLQTPFLKQYRMLRWTGVLLSVPLLG